MIIEIISNFSTCEDMVAFIIDDTGKLLEIHLNVAAWAAPIPPLFDVCEFKNYYLKLTDRINIKDIGYWTPVGTYVHPDPAFRLTLARRQISELVEHLDNTSASLETMLAYIEGTKHKAAIPGEDHRNRSRICAAARQYLEKFKPDEEEEDENEDKTALPNGVVHSVNDGQVTCCNFKIPQHKTPGNKSLLDTVTKEHFCCRECLDLSRNGSFTPRREDPKSSCGQTPSAASSGGTAPPAP